jgi:cardiolipin synthase
VDAFGSLDFVASEKQAELEAVGIKVKVFKTIPARKINTVLGLFLRDHRKLLIVDGKEAFIGGVCFDDSQETWHDVSIKISGEIVPTLQIAFENIFSNMEKTKPKEMAWTADNFAVLSGTPRNRSVYREITTAIRTAKDSITILTPYFAPPVKLLIALFRARKRGVAITLLFSEKTDNHLGDLVLRSYLTSLLKKSFKVYFSTDAINHGKVVMVDKTWVTVGSTNFDRLSLLYNNELNLVSQNRQFIADMVQVLDEVKQVSKVVSLSEWKDRSLKQKVLEVLVRPLRLIV